MGRFKGPTGWHRQTEDTFVDITPRGEEGRHIADPTCECVPRLSKDFEGRQMIIHNSWDGREGFELAEQNLPAHYKGRKAA